jgi:hypothetical protein
MDAMTDQIDVYIGKRKVAIYMFGLMSIDQIKEFTGRKPFRLRSPSICWTATVHRRSRRAGHPPRSNSARSSLHRRRRITSSTIGHRIHQPKS